MLINLVQDLKDEDLHIVGCSLGYYYALILLERIISEKAIHYHLINPSLVPWKSLKKHLNTKMKNYKTGEEYLFTSSFLDALEHYTPIIKDISNTTSYFGNNDKTLHHSITKNWIQTFNIECNVVETTQGHRYKDISTVIHEINELETAKDL